MIQEMSNIPSFDARRKTPDPPDGKPFLSKFRKFAQNGCSNWIDLYLLKVLMVAFGCLAKINRKIQKLR